MAVPVDRDDAMALIERDAVVDVPTVSMDDDLIEGLLAGQDRRQHDAIVIDARLGVEDRDLVGFGSGFEQFFQGAPRRHAVADDDEALSRFGRRGGRKGFLLDVLHGMVSGVWRARGRGEIREAPPAEAGDGRDQALAAASADRSSQVRRQRMLTLVRAVSAASARKAKIASPIP